MAIVLQTNARDAAANAIVDLADAGAGAATIQIATTAFASILATITCSDPAYGASSSSVAALNGTPLADASADNSGTAAVWRLRDSNSVLVLDGPVSGSGGGDINLSDNARNAALNAIGALCNGGSIQYTTAGDTSFATPILTHTLSNPAFAAAASGAMAVDVTPALTANASAGGTATLFRFLTSAAAEVFRGTVGTSGADLNFDNNVWASSQPVTLASFSLTMAATSAASDGALVINNTSIAAGQNVEITSGNFTQPA